MAIMRGRASDIVDSAIRHAGRQSRNPNYRWPIARAALTRILEDLERRAPGDPSLDRLRAFIAEGDRKQAARPGDR